VKIRAAWADTAANSTAINQDTVKDTIIFGVKVAAGPIIVLNSFPLVEMKELN